MQHKKLDRSQWQAWVIAQEKSGLSQQAFCAKHDLSASRFWYYRSLFKTKTPQSVAPRPSSKKILPVMPIKIQAGLSANPSVSGVIRLTLQTGLQCAVPGDIDLKRLQQLLGVLYAC